MSAAGPVQTPSSAQECAHVLCSDLYALLDRLTTMQAGLMPLWDPEATIHPLTDARRRAARDELQAAIADLTIWIERALPPSAKRSIQGPVDADIGTTARRSDGTAG